MQEVKAKPDMPAGRHGGHAIGQSVRQDVGVDLGQTKLRDGAREACGIEARRMRGTEPNQPMDASNKACAWHGERRTAFGGGQRQALAEIAGEDRPRRPGSIEQAPATNATRSTSGSLGQRRSGWISESFPADEASA